MTKRIFMDSNPLLDLVFERGNWMKIAAFIDSNQGIVTNLTVLGELKYGFLLGSASRALNSEKKFELVKFLKKNEKFTRLAYKKYLGFYYYLEKKLGIYETKKEDEDLSSLIGVKYSLLPNDAMIVATMLNNGIKSVYTSDQDFRKIEGIKVIEP